MAQRLPAAHTSLPGDRRGDGFLSDSAEGLPPHHRALWQEMARLEATLTAIHQRLNTLATVSQETGTGAADQIAATVLETLEMNEAQRHAAVQQQWHDEMAVVEASFQQEAVDHTWAAHAVDRILQATEHEELAALSVPDVDCRATLCRVEVDQDDPEMVQQWLGRLVPHVADTLPTMTVMPADEGANRLVIFLTREGYDLPARGQGR